MTARRTLSGADVDALFAGHFERVEIATCDNCRLPIEDENALTFGSDDDFEMPVTVNGDLERELIILRLRHKRRCITLCYACTDALQEPMFGHGARKLVTVLRQPTPVDDATPRLFAVE